MKKLTDKNQSLDWLLIDYEEDYKKEENRDFIKEELQELNTWGSNNISEYISEQSLGDFLYDMCDIYNDHYDKTQCFHLLAYENSILIGTALLSINSKDIKTAFNSYTLPNNLKILILVVNPNKQNTGIGTRMIKSIIDNQVFFSKEINTFGISTDIHNKNISSQKAFLKNNFTVYNPPQKSPKYSRYFYIENKSNNPNLDQL